jgi:hypothetical protein
MDPCHVQRLIAFVANSVRGSFSAGRFRRKAYMGYSYHQTFFSLVSSTKKIHNLNA